MFIHSFLGLLSHLLLLLSVAYFVYIFASKEKEFIRLVGQTLALGLVLVGLLSTLSHFNKISHYKHHSLGPSIERKAGENPYKFKIHKERHQNPLNKRMM